MAERKRPRPSTGRRSGVQRTQEPAAPAGENGSSHSHLVFRPRARVLELLGEQLIRSAGIAAFELAKNAYDADASSFTLTIKQADDAKRGEIVAEDNGSGMTWETVIGPWLEPGSRVREDERVRGHRSPRYKRLPMGGKGVGRFAAQKLGAELELVTRAARGDEVHLSVDWDEVAGEGFLDEKRITIRRRSPVVFSGNKTGTRLTIRRLRGAWDRRTVRELARMLNSIQSPFSGKGSFRTALSVPEHEDWLSGITTLEDVKARALYRLSATIRGKTLSYDYSFTPWPELRVAGRTTSQKFPLQRPPIGRKANPDSLDLGKYKIGPVDIELLVFDLDPHVLSVVTDKKGLREYLQANGGVRVYREDVRVFDYGEPGNDWLDLEGRRINRPGLSLSNNLVIGGVTLRAKSSGDLREKTNREGFVENDAYHDLVLAVQFAILQAEAERKIDKARLRQASPRGSSGPEPILADVAAIRALADAGGYLKEIGPQLSRIERDYVEVRDRLLVSASAGLSLAVVIHEVEKGLDELQRAVKSSAVPQRVRALAERLSELINGFGAIVRRGGNTKERASGLIRQALFNCELRLKAHGVVVDRMDVRDDFGLVCSRRLVVATLMNLIDNAIYWLDTHPGKKKSLRIFASRDVGPGGAIVVADTNTLGFIDPPETITQPFFTRRPDGMGLGLHVADEVMKVHKGSLEFLDPGDVGLETSYKAVVALHFPEVT